MRIVMVNKFAHVTGGADHHCLALARALRDRGHEVAFLSTADERNVESVGSFVPCSVTRDDKAGLAISRQAVVATQAMWNARGAAAMRTLTRSFRPDVVHAHKLYPQLSVSPLVVARRLRVPVVQTVHDYEFVSASPYDHTGSRRDRDEASGRARALNTIVFVQKRALHRRLVTSWVTVSRYVQASLGRVGIDATVLPNFVSADAGVRPLAERRGIAFAGRLSSEKGVEHVLALADGLPSVQVAIAGDGPLRSSIERAATRHPNLSYRGLLDSDDVTQLMATARVVVVPSLWQEPGGLSALEAMAVGTPVVAYRSGGLAEYVGDHRAGLVVEPTVEELENACTRLLGDDALWEASSRAARETAATAHSVQAYCTRVENVYAQAARA